MDTQTHITGILLAAGLSRRAAPHNKLLHSIGGVAMVRHAAMAMAAGGIDDIIVVIGHDREAVSAALADLPLRLVFNPRYAEGMGTSIAAGLSAVSAKTAGAMIALGDMPWVTAQHVQQIRNRFIEVQPDSIVVPVFGEVRGHPVLFSRRWFPELATLNGDRGAREILDKAGSAVHTVSIADDGVLRDVDVPARL